MLRIKLVKSPIAGTKRNRATVAALGLRKMHHVVEHEDSPSIRGMVHQVKHLLEIEISDQPAAKAKKAAPKPSPAKNAKADETKTQAVEAVAEEKKPARPRKKAAETGTDSVE